MYKIIALGLIQLSLSQMNKNRIDLFSTSFCLFISVAKQQVVAYTQKSQIKHENRHIQLVREYGFHPRTKATVEDGDVLPKKFEPFPENMYGRPLEEIDQFIYEEVSGEIKI